MKTLFTLFAALTLAAFAADDFPLLGAAEAQLTRKYGKPVPVEKQLVEVEKPELYPYRKILYRVDDVTITVWMRRGKAEMLMFAREKEGISDVQVDQILKRCGGKWDGWNRGYYTRTDGSFASRSLAGDFSVASGTAMIRNAVLDALKKQKPITGL